MKRVVVFLLTAVLITGVCMTPTIAYATATSVGSKTADADDSGGKGVVDDAEDTESESNNKDKGTGNKAGVSNEDTDTSDEDASNESTKGVADGTENTEENGDETTTDSEEVVDVETVPESFEDLSEVDNLDGLRQYISSSSAISNRYLLKNDVIYLAYNSDASGEPTGYFYPDITYTKGEGYALSFNSVEFEEDSEGNQVPVVDENNDAKVTWNSLEDVKTLDASIKYVKDNIDNLTMVSKEPGDIYVSVLSPIEPEHILCYTSSGDYIGSYKHNVNDVNRALLDTDLVSLKADISHSLRYDDKKETAFLTVKYAFDYPKALGEATLSGFTIIGEDESQVILDGIDTSGYLGELQGTTSGVISDIKLENSDAKSIVLRTNVGSVTHNFTVDKLNNIITDEQDTRVPNVTFGDLPSNATKGEPITITMFSDIEAVLMFNGRSSGTPVKSYTFTVSQNGEYSWSAKTEAGKYSSGKFAVNCFSSELKSVNYGSYGSGGITSLPKTGGVNTMAVVLSGIIVVLGGICVIKKDAILMLVSMCRRKVSV